ncbi:CBN-UPP-1 protein [Aphelenchoides avenae]|nr:CBN-UPP-1 protein [Aphelenchus avenae]
MSSNPVRVFNVHLSEQADDVFYHFGISKAGDDLPGLFRNTKFVCTGGSGGRLKMYADIFAQECGIACSGNLSRSDRFILYKTGPVLWVNHGMGVPSLSIMLNEIIKLLHYAGATDVTFIRVGTSGGIGVDPGTVVVSSGAVNGLLEDKHIQFIQGNIVKRDAHLDAETSTRLSTVAQKLGYPVDQGKTMCADDFYEGQMRLDGAFCEYTTADKFAFLNRLHDFGVKNIEMESTGFAALTNRAGVKAAIICVILVNRLKGDQVKLDQETYHEFEMRPFRVVSAFMREKLILN